MKILILNFILYLININMKNNISSCCFWSSKGRNSWTNIVFKICFGKDAFIFMVIRLEWSLFIYCIFCVCLQDEWENYLLWLADEGGGDTLAWGKSPWVWGQIRQVASYTLDHKAARECRWLIGTKQERQRSAHHSWESANLPRSTVSFKLFSNSCARWWCLCDGSLQFYVHVCVSEHPFALFNLFCVQVATTFSAGEKVL